MNAMLSQVLENIPKVAISKDAEINKIEIIFLVPKKSIIGPPIKIPKQPPTNVATE